MVPSKPFFSILFFIFFLSSVSAFDFDNVKVVTKEPGDVYDTISIVNAFGLGDKLAEYKLTYNSEQCLIDCYAEGIAKLYSPDAMFRSISFLDSKLASKSMSNYHMYIQDQENITKYVNDYEKVCIDDVKNGTTCEMKVIGNHKETTSNYYWKEYKGEILQPSTYNWKLEGKKKINENVDWQVSAFGSVFNEWAWWNSSWGSYKNITFDIFIPQNYSVQVIINASSATNAGFGDVRFINSSDTGELFYWMEYNDSAQAVFWVKVPDNQTIKMYYRNPTAETTSNIKQAFIVGDDFNDASIDTTIWNVTTAGGGAITEKNGLLNVTHLGVGAQMAWTGILSDYVYDGWNMTFVANINFTVKAAVKNSGFSTGNGTGTTMFGSAYTMGSTSGSSFGVRQTSGSDWDQAGFPFYATYMLVEINRYNVAGATKTQVATRLLNPYNISSYNRNLTYTSTDATNKAYVGAGFEHEDAAGRFFVDWMYVRRTMFGNVASGQQDPRVYLGAEVNTTTDTIFPSVNFSYQYPADLTSTNIFNNVGLNITYNISDTNLNLSTIFIYYKTNKTTSDTSYYVNGTGYSGYNQRAYLLNITHEFRFRLSDNEVYPGSYNLNEKEVENTIHGNFELVNQGQYAKIEILNVSNATKYNFFEIMANTSGTTSLRVYYCNSTYSTGLVTNTGACALFASIAGSGTYNHIHTEYSKHQLAPFAINLTTGQLNGIYVTNVSYFLIRGLAPSTWIVYNLSNTTRSDTIQFTSNGGSTWDKAKTTIDSHIHQYDGTDKLFYYACANDTFNNENCSEVRQDLIDLAGLPPTAPFVYSPNNSVYINSIPIDINYTESISPNGYQISHYNISLVLVNETFVRTIHANNSVNLSYLWDASTTAEGEYKIKVEVYDNLSQSSIGYSSNFSLGDGIPPNVTDVNEYPAVPATYVPLQSYYFSVNVSDDVNIFTVWLEFNGTNYTATNVSEVFNVSFNDLGVGVYAYTWYANDTRGNMNNTVTGTYTITKANSSVYTYINNSRANKNYLNGTQLNITGALIAGKGTINLYINDTPWNYGDSPLFNMTNFTVGTYAINTTYLGNTNYSASYEVWNLSITLLISGCITNSTTLRIPLANDKHFIRLCYHQNFV